MSRHHLRNFAAPSSRESAKRILEGIDEKNRNKRLLGARLQKIAVRYESSFGPDLDAIEAFKRGEDYQGYVGKGKNKRLKFEVKGDKLYLHGHNIATKTKDGIKVSNAGFDTGLTYSTLKELGINAKRTPGGKVILHNTEIDAASGQSVFVPTGEISSSPVRATKPQRKQRHNRTVTEQSNFRRDVESRERAEQGRNERELPLSSTAIQPKDQRIINKITGVKSKIPKETRATDAHHIFPVEKYPELKNNPAQGIMLTRAEHKELHDLNPTEGMRALRRRVGKLKIAERLRAFTNTSSFVGNMRYDQDEQSMTGILSGKHYKWCGVPEKTFDAFQGAGSAGAFFNRQVKGQFDCSSGGRLDAVKSRISKLRTAESWKDRKIREQREFDDDGLDDFSKGEVTTFDEMFTDDIPLPRVEGFSDKFVDTKVTGTTPEGKYITTDEPVNVDRSIANMEEGTSALGEKIEDLRIERKLLKERGEGETFVETFTRKFGAPMLNKQPAGPEPKVGPYNQGTISRDLAKRLAKLQKTAGIEPLVRKKKKGKAIRKIAPKVGMIQTAKMMSADAIINSYKKIKPDIKGKSGVYDPVENRILDARIPLDAIRLQNFFESGQNSIGFNSITDTRQGPMEDIEVVRSQLKQIEQSGGVPALGFDEGSLEALDVKIGSENDIMTNLLENQRSTGILDYNLQFKIEDNPKFRKN